MTKKLQCSDTEWQRVTMGCESIIRWRKARVAPLTGMTDRAPTSCYWAKPTPRRDHGLAVMIIRLSYQRIWSSNHDLLITTQPLMVLLCGRDSPDSGWRLRLRTHLLGNWWYLGKPSQKTPFLLGNLGNGQNKRYSSGIATSRNPKILKKISKMNAQNCLKCKININLLIF